MPDDRLTGIAEAVADGSPVNWAEIHSSAEGDTSDHLQQLHVIAQIAEVFRRHVVQDDLTANRPLGVWGPLVIQEKLGSGAFGDVFRAIDSKLGREVALKILRRRGGQLHSPVAALIREGHLLARVNHPNVMAVYGAQEVEGDVGIWGEFLRGRTLAQIVADDGPLSAQETAVVGDAVCRALAAVHRAGLLHRDVKAQNVMRETGGRIVLMDFGLGREVSAIGPNPDVAGTPKYMAPEVLLGQPPSVQSDLYSVGVLLFFLATGTYPFEGRTLDEIRRSHAGGPRQRLQDLQPSLPLSFIRVVERALARNPSDRFESSGAMLGAVAQGQAAEAPVKRSAVPLTLGLGLAVAVVAGVVATPIHRWVEPDPQTPRPITFPLAAPVGTRFSEGARNVAAVSPDGRYVAFVATAANGSSHLWLRSFESLEAQPIPDSEGARSPFWAPDSSGFAYFDRKGLIRISLEGVKSEPFVLATEQHGGTWGAGDRLLVALQQQEGLFLLSATGGSLQNILAPDTRNGEFGYLWPQFLSDGNRFIYFVLSNDERVRGIYLGALDRKSGHRLVGSNASGIVADGKLLFVRDGDLVAQPFDETGERVTGQPEVVLKQVATTAAYRSAVSASAVGSLAYSAGLVSDVTELTWFDRSGRSLGTIGARAKHRNPAVSQDGRLLASELYRDSLREVNVVDFTRGASTRIAHSVAVEFPVWGPDGRLAYASTDNGWSDIYTRNVDFLTTPQVIVASPSNKMPTDWSRDGQHLAYAELGADGSYDLWVMALDTRRRIPIARSNAHETSGKFSPDGRLLAFVSTASGSPEVYTQRFPDGSAWPISVNGGDDPHWTSERTITFLDATASLVEVDVGADGRAGQQPPRRLMRTSVITSSASRNHYAWDKGARRVLINTPRQDSVSGGVNVVLNWKTLINHH